MTRVIASAIALMTAPSVTAQPAQAEPVPLATYKAGALASANGGKSWRALSQQ